MGMPYSRKKCRYCNRKASAKLHISSTGTCSDCALSHSIQMTKASIAISELINPNPKPGAGKRKAPRARKVEIQSERRQKG